MSRAGNPYDNAHVERYMTTRKAEEVHLQRYRTVEDLLTALSAYLEDTDNTTRLNSALGDLPTAEYDAQHHLTRSVLLKLLTPPCPMDGSHSIRGSISDLA
jgi:transposase InsO family protein